MPTVPPVTTPPLTPPLDTTATPCPVEQPCPFQAGDVIRYRYDSPECAVRVVAVVRGDLSNEWCVKLQPFGLRSGHFSIATLHIANQFKLLKRPAPGEILISPRPCALQEGITGLQISSEFIDDTAAWVLHVGPQYTAEAVGRLMQLACFISGAYGELTDLYASDGGGVRGAQVWLRGMPLAERQPAVRKLLATMLTAQANRWDQTIQRCASCLAERRDLTECPHFTCGRCGLGQTEHCRDCEALALTGVSLVCRQCCFHGVCTDCRTVVTRKQLHTCGRCQSHCPCPRCEHPNCSGQCAACCGRCNAHCTCNSTIFPKVAGRFAKFPAPRGEQGLKRLLGTELETLWADSYSPKLRAAVKKWGCSIVTDGSIGYADRVSSFGHSARGMELTTSAAGGSAWFDMINDLGEGFWEAKARTGPTCGQHVHVDAGDLDAWDLRRFIRIYAHVEEAMFDAQPAGRQDNEFCMRCGPHYLQWLKDMPNGRLSKQNFALQHFKLLPYKAGQGFRGAALDAKTAAYETKARIKQLSNTKGGDRYKAVNMQSYWYRGTIEFRLGAGTNDPQKIAHWGVVCGSVVDFATKHGDADVDKLLKMPQRDALLATLDRNPDSAAWLKTRWARFAPSPTVRRWPQLPADLATGED